MEADRLNELLTALAEGSIDHTGLRELRTAAELDPELSRAVTLFLPLSKEERRRTRPPSVRRPTRPAPRAPLWFAAAAAAAAAGGFWVWTGASALEATIVGTKQVAASDLVVIETNAPGARARVFVETRKGWEELPWRFSSSGEETLQLRARGAGLTRYQYGPHQLLVLAGPPSCRPESRSWSCSRATLDLDVAPPRFEVGAQIAKRGMLSRGEPLTPTAEPDALKRLATLTLPAEGREVELSFAPALPVASPLRYVLCAQRAGVTRKLGELGASRSAPGRWVGSRQALLDADLLIITALPAAGEGRTADLGCGPYAAPFTQRSFRTAAAPFSPDSGEPEKT
ncbi:MAG: hypothetical protein AAFU79_03185 [Myxococcota bacterium]